MSSGEHELKRDTTCYDTLLLAYSRSREILEDGGSEESVLEIQDTAIEGLRELGFSSGEVLGTLSQIVSDNEQIEELEEDV